ncbi:MAG: hypothetical protein WCF85_21165 [Rhodospirillaceae bacterium]
MDKRALIQRIELNISNQGAWDDAIHAFIEGRDFASVHALLRARHDLIGDAASFTVRVVATLLAGRANPGSFHWLLERSSSDSAFHSIFELGTSLEAGLDYRLDDAVVHLRKATWHAAHTYKSVFSRDGEFQAMLPPMMRDANLLEASDYDACCGPTGIVLPEMTLVGGPAAMAGDTMIVAACDGYYLRHYNKRFVTSIGQHCPNQDTLLHVINPGPDDVSLLESLIRNHPRLWATIEQGPPYKVYYASCRFLIAERVMDRFGCHVVTVDVDGVFHERFPWILECARSQDVAYLGTNAYHFSLPCLISAAFLFVRNSETGRVFCGLSVHT